MRASHMGRDQPVHARGSRSRRILPALLAAALSVAVAAAIGELFLRVRVGPPVRFLHPQERYLPDEEIGHRLAPGQTAWTHDAPVRTNAEGMRGPQRSPQAPAATRRLLAIGDSQTFGNGLSLEETWPAQLERALAARHPDQRFEVLNAGIPGTDTWQHERLLARLAERLALDAVVLGFYVNDVVPRSEPRGFEDPTNTPWKRVGYLLKRSALLTLGWQTLNAFRHGGRRERRVLTGEPDPVVAAGWQQVERSLGAMRRIALRRGADFTVVVLPRRDQVSGEIAGRAYNRRIAEIAVRLGIPVVDVSAALRRAYREHGDALFIAWDGHNAAAANEVIARAVARELAAADRAASAERARGYGTAPAESDDGRPAADSALR